MNIEGKKKMPSKTENRLMSTIIVKTFKANNTRESFVKLTHKNKGKEKLFL